MILHYGGALSYRPILSNRGASALFFISGRFMALTRVQHWATRAFHTFLLESKDKEFAWGSWDCCMFVADAIQAITGVDIADDFRGKYSDQASAMQVIKTVTGGSTVADAAAYCAVKHGLSELQSPLMAQRGDLVIVKDAVGLVAGVVHLNGRHVVVVGEGGLKRQPITNVTRAWRV